LAFEPSDSDDGTDWEMIAHLVQQPDGTWETVEHPSLSEDRDEGGKTARE
jgi:hypothetical protein